MLFHILPNNLWLHSHSTLGPDRGSPAFPLGHSEWFHLLFCSTSIDSFSHKRTTYFETVLLCVHNNLCTARMRLYCLIQMVAVWKNRTRKFHSVPKVTQTSVFFICWPNRRRCRVRGGKGDRCRRWRKSSKSPYAPPPAIKWVAVGYIVPSGSRPAYTIMISKR